MEYELSNKGFLASKDSLKRELQSLYEPLALNKSNMRKNFAQT